MKRFKNLLVVLDSDGDQQPALARAADLAKLNRAKIQVLAVFEDPPIELRALVGALKHGNLRQQLERLQRERIEKLLTPLREQGIDVGLSFAWYQAPVVPIVQAVLRNGHDLVLKTVRRVTGLNATLFHPAERQLMRKCPCPVWMVKPESQPQYRRIAAAVDPFPDDTVNNQLNEQILALASSLALLENAELHVVHAHRQYDDVYLEHLGVDPGEAERQSQALRRQRLDQLLAATSTEYRLHTPLGPAAEVIPSVIESELIELIVMGTLARSGVPGLLIGNTAEQVLDRVHCDVLAIKPAGFVSPISMAELSQASVEESQS